jgi:predicted MFS family arabinose efflux permease
MPSQTPPRSLRTIGLVLAIACGLTVANLYYAQPLLDLMARDFHTSEGTATTIVTLTQLGYALGLALVLPLGDLLENRKLASRTLLGTAAALAIAAAAPSFGVFVAMAALIGVTSVVAQILVPFAASLAPPEQRGRFVGQIMSGLLLGILLARTASSLIADQFGWRTVYALSAVAMVAMSFTLMRILPSHRPTHTATYRQLLGSVVQIARSEPILRRRAACQALMFAAFTSYWTAIGYELIGGHGFSQAGVGIFALVGAAGATAAPIAGRIGDRGHGHVASGVVLALGIGAPALAGLGAGSIVLLGLGGVLLDLAVQSHQVLSQREIYQLRPDARARINTVYMTSIFIVGAIASATTGWLHEHGGWGATMTFAAVLPAIAFAIWSTSLLPSRRHAAATRTA